MTEDKEKLPQEIGPDVEDTKTVCRDCAFAEYEDVTQTGCSLGKLDKFREVGGCVIVPAYDEEKEFFIIQDRFCVFWRSLEWGASLEKAGFNEKSIRECVRGEVNGKFATILYFDKDSKLKDVKSTVASLKSGFLVPTKIIFCDNKSGIDTKDILEIAKSSSIEWRLERIAEADATQQRCVDICVRKLRAMDNPYYSCFRAGVRVIKNFYSDIDKALNDDLIKFLALYPKEEEEDGLISDGFVAQTHLHKTIGGNREKSVLAKLIHVTESQECPELIKPLTEIVSL